VRPGSWINGVLAGAAGFQAAAPEMTEKLPFWLFWLLLCVILLLLAFIFLRDKDLRRRMSSFLSGARRRMIRLRLQAKLNREKEKKAALWKELGKTAWSDDITAECIAGECSELAAFEDDMHIHQMAWHEIYSRIETLGREHEETAKRFRALLKGQEDARKPFEEEMRALAARKSEILDAIGGAAWEIDSSEAQIKALDREARAIENNSKMADLDKAGRLNKIQEKASLLSERIKALQSKVPLLHEERQDLERRQTDTEARIDIFNGRIEEIQDELKVANRFHERELREWLKNKERAQDKILEIRRLMEPLFETMGRILDEARVPENALTVVYFQIDAVNRTIQDIEARIERLR
jgi:chromosome segregation ATPase